MRGERAYGSGAPLSNHPRLEWRIVGIRRTTAIIQMRSPSACFSRCRPFGIVALVARPADRSLARRLMRIDRFFFFTRAPGEINRAPILRKYRLAAGKQFDAGIFRARVRPAATGGRSNERIMKTRVLYRNIDGNVVL